MAERGEEFKWELFDRMLILCWCGRLLLVVWIVRLNGDYEAYNGSGDTSVSNLLLFLNDRGDYSAPCTSLSSFPSSCIISYFIFNYFFDEF